MKHFFISKYSFLFLTLGYAFGILWVSLQPDYPTGAPANVLREEFRNFLHVPAYAGLAGLMMLTFMGFRRGGFQTLPVMEPVPESREGLKPSPTYTTFAVYAWIFILATLYGILNEFVQAAVPGRFFSIEDMLRNAIGAGVGVWVVLKVTK